MFVSPLQEWAIQKRNCGVVFFVDEPLSSGDFKKGSKLGKKQKTMRSSIIPKLGVHFY